ncbi:MAG: cysteine desulfurase [Acidobacteriota bacterium]|jgi:cysteine desulfurase/selenocysteine lyase|nr:cysteine desulfurase [Acidobacteriota bacterium]
MTTSKDVFPAQAPFDPALYRLPSAEDIARLAGAYFPEFGAASPPDAPDASKAPEASVGALPPVAPVPASLPVVGAPAAPAASYAPTLLSEAEARAEQAKEKDALEAEASAGGGRAVRAEASPESGRDAGRYVGERSLGQIRADFPILSEKVDGGHQLVWFDNAATTQRPRQVIDRISYYYEHENSNVHRGAHTLAARSTDAYEDARKKVAVFLGAPAPGNIVFVRGTTEGINLVAQAFAKPRLGAGDEIVLTVLEHHANIVPWQMVAEETGAVLKVAPVDDAGQILLGEYARLFTRRTKFAAVTHVSNALGTVTPVAEMVQAAHAFGVPVLVDGAQSVSHVPLDVTALDADFFVFSGHKIYGPTGIGALYGKEEWLEAAKPYQGGGNMIADVTFERTVYHRAPQKFEAGTGNIADAVGLGAALDYVAGIGIHNIAAWEHELLEYATAELKKIPGLRLVGTAPAKASVLSFVMDGRSVEEVGRHLSRAGIAVRAGHHCAQPILRRFGLEGTVRPSLAFYNTPQEVESMAATLRRLQ